MRITKVLIALAVGAAAAAPVATAADQGNWVWDNCYAYGAGDGCAYYDTFNHAPSMASNLRDSYFSDNLYSNGALLNDQVKYFRNTFNNITLCLYQNSNYVTPLWLVQPSSNTNALPWQQSSGASSFKSC